MDKVLIVISTYKSLAKQLAATIEKFLTKKHFFTTVYHYDGYEHSVAFDEDYAFAISLGGDGTVLFTARYCAPRGIPVFPINFGQFGFIANIDPDNWLSELESFLDGNAERHSRMLLEACVVRENKKICFFNALNDVVVSGSGIAKLIDVDIFYNKIPFDTYRADGVIVSTPTGSTAYSAASGGPILDPNLCAFVLTPISPFSLSNRSIVLSSSGELKIEILPTRQKNIILSVDGQQIFKLIEGDQIFVTESDFSVTLIGCAPVAFYKALRSKLGWSGSYIVNNKER